MGAPMKQMQQQQQEMQKSNIKPDFPFHYALTFEVKFPYDHDTVYLAHCYPYTFTDHCLYLRRVCLPEARDRIRKTVLCKSLAGNDVDVLIVTNFTSEPIELSVRKAVVLTSRVHPGETNS